MRGKFFEKNKIKSHFKERKTDTRSDLDKLCNPRPANSRMSHTSKVDRHTVTMATQAGRSSRQASCKFRGNDGYCLDDLNDIAVLPRIDRAVMLGGDGRDRLSCLSRASDRALKG